MKIPEPIFFCFSDHHDEQAVTQFLLFPSDTRRGPPRFNLVKVRENIHFSPTLSISACSFSLIYHSPIPRQIPPPPYVRHTIRHLDCSAVCRAASNKVGEDHDPAD